MSVCFAWPTVSDVMGASVSSAERILLCRRILVHVNVEISWFLGFAMALRVPR